MENETETVKAVVDVFSIGTVVGALAGILPSIAAIFTIVWTLIRIWETKTVQSLLKRRASKHEQDS